MSTISCIITDDIAISIRVQAPWLEITALPFTPIRERPLEWGRTKMVVIGKAMRKLEPFAYGVRKTSKPSLDANDPITS